MINSYIRFFDIFPEFTWVKKRNPQLLHWGLIYFLSLGGKFDITCKIINITINTKNTLKYIIQNISLFSVI